MEQIPQWARRLQHERQRRAWSLKDIAARLRAVAPPDVAACLPTNESLRRMVRTYEAGEHKPDEVKQLLFAAVFGIDRDVLFADDQPDNMEMLEFLRRVAASDAGETTVRILEMATDDLASAYHSSSATVLLNRIAPHLRYVTRLLDGKATLDERKRLVVVGGWLTLLQATCHVDLRQDAAATAGLRIAQAAAQHTGHHEITAWCLETEAWRVLTLGQAQQAVELSQAAQDVAPKNGSAILQATAQESTARAELGDRRATQDALARLERLVSPLAIPDRPEHHYRYDPAKGEFFTATTLARIGDPAAEAFLRHVLVQMESPHVGPPRPRRAAVARLDLGVTLMKSGQLDEAALVTGLAMHSGRIAPSDAWRAAEVITAVERRHLPEATSLRDAYRELGSGERRPGQ